MPKKPKTKKGKTKSGIPQPAPYVFLVEGKWHVRRHFAVVDENGKTTYKQRAKRCIPETKERAAEIAAAIEVDHKAEIEAKRRLKEDEKLPTVEKFVSAFVGTKKGSVAVRTHDNYDWHYKKYIKGTSFGRLLADKVGPYEIQAFYSELTQKGSSGTAVRKVHNFLSMAFNQGVRWELVRRNPCKGAVLPRPNDTEIEFLDADEAKTFAETCFSKPEWLVLAFALETGMRPGEYLGLQWKHLNLNNLTAKIVRAAVFPKSGSFHYGDPKTKKSKRTVDITEKMAEALREHKKRRAELIDKLNKIIAAPLKSSKLKSEGVNFEERKIRRKRAKERLDALIEHDLVFPAYSGTPIAPRNLGNRAMMDACTAAGLTHHSLYSLRHSMATIALASGADIKTISERLGHASVKITWDTYSHVLPVMRNKAISVLAEALY